MYGELGRKWPETLCDVNTVECDTFTWPQVAAPQPAGAAADGLPPPPSAAGAAADGRPPPSPDAVDGRFWLEGTESEAI